MPELVKHYCQVPAPVHHMITHVISKVTTPQQLGYEGYSLWLCLRMLVIGELDEMYQALSNIIYRPERKRGGYTCRANLGPMVSNEEAVQKVKRLLYTDKGLMAVNLEDVHRLT